MVPFSPNATAALADTLGLSVDLSPLERLAEKMPSQQLVEWSVNGPQDGRGQLRVSLWTENLQHAGDAVALLPPKAQAIEKRLPGSGMCGMGVAFGKGQHRWRWYRLAAANGGGEMIRAAWDVLPEIKEPAEALAEQVGGWSQCMAVGLETTDQASIRSTVYFRVGDPESLLRLMAKRQIAASREAQLLVRGVMGLDSDHARPWPKCWIAQSVGQTGGMKLYYFSRRDNHRRSDAALLDAVQAHPKLIQAVNTLAAHHPARPFKGVLPGMVQLLGLRLEGPPRWTIYLAPR